MNFLDTYDLAGTSAVPESQPQQSLNEEVSQVMGNLGQFWGGFRKQSQAALQIARKDLSEVVTHAQKGLSKLTSEPSAAPSTEPTNSDSDGSSPLTPSDAERTNSSDDRQQAPSASTSTETLFSRFQSALPPNIVATVHSHLPDTIKHASENIDLTQLRTSLLSEFQRAQGATRAQAEEYVHKSEVLLREAVKEAGDVLREAVKLLPPEDAEPSRGTSSLVWDGADMWTLPLEPRNAAASGIEQAHEPKVKRGTGDAQRAIATRAELLFERLKNDSTIIRRDPEDDPDSRELYAKWLSSEVDTKEGGIEGDEWSMKITALLNEPSSDEGLKATLDTLVPSELTRATFWARFFFRSYQIEVQREKRKVLIEGTIEDEDFSWEDDEEDPIAPAFDPQSAATSSVLPGTSGQASTSLDTKIPTPVTNTRASSAASLQTHTTLTAGTQESSEESYDVVSSGKASPSTDSKPGEKNDDSDDPDSDWE